MATLANAGAHHAVVRRCGEGTPSEVAGGVAVLKESPGRSGPVRRFAVAAAAAVAGGLLLASCAAGQHAQTVGQLPAIDGVSATSGTIGVEAAAVLAPDNGPSYPKGSNALLQLVLINNGSQPVKLLSVSSPVAAGALVSNAGLPDSVSSSDSASASASASASQHATSTTSPSSTGQTSSSPSGTGSVTGSPISAPKDLPIAVPAGQSIQVGYSVAGANIVLNNLTTSLFPAQNVPVTFTFQTGTSTTSTLSVTLSVKLSSEAPSAPVLSEATVPAD